MRKQKNWLQSEHNYHVWMFQVFSKQLVEKVRELDSQKNQTEKAFHGFLPPSLVRDMKREQVKLDSALLIMNPTETTCLCFQPTIEEFECVTIFFGDILGFEEIVTDCTPTEVINNNVIDYKVHSTLCS